MMEKKRLTAFALVRRIGGRRERIGQFPLSPMEGRSAEDRKRNALAMARRQLDLAVFSIGFMVRDAVCQKQGADAAKVTVSGEDGVSVEMQFYVSSVYER